MGEHIEYIADNHAAPVIEARFRVQLVEQVSVAVQLEGCTRHPVVAGGARSHHLVIALLLGQSEVTQIEGKV
jgi:hypothetical protein